MNQVIYVKIQKDNDGSTFLEAYKSFKDFEEDGAIGIYRLVEVKYLENVKTLRLK